MREIFSAANKTGENLNLSTEDTEITDKIFKPFFDGIRADKI